MEPPTDNCSLNFAWKASLLPNIQKIWGEGNGGRGKGGGKAEPMLKFFKSASDSAPQHEVITTSFELLEGFYPLPSGN